jgi:hypothetical protein
MNGVQPEDRVLRLESRLRVTQRLTTGTCLAIVVGGLVAFAPSQQRQRFTEIDVERINVIEKDGRLRLVISNRDRSPPPMIRGKAFGYPGGSRPGLISYNDEVTENGGFIWSGGRNPDGTFSAEHSLTFDQFDQDQIIALQYIDSNGSRRHGLQILDRSNRSLLEQDSAWRVVDALPAGPGRESAVGRFRAEFPTAQRLYVGRDRAKAATVLLADGRGRTRLRLFVDSIGTARIHFLDEKGGILYSLPDSARDVR